MSASLLRWFLSLRTPIFLKPSLKIVIKKYAFVRNVSCKKWLTNVVQVSYSFPPPHRYLLAGTIFYGVFSSRMRSLITLTYLQHRLHKFLNVREKWDEMEG
jgi:hypothetical protein